MKKSHRITVYVILFAYSAVLIPLGCSAAKTNNPVLWALLGVLSFGALVGLVLQIKRVRASFDEKEARDLESFIRSNHL